MDTDSSDRIPERDPPPSPARRGLQRGRPGLSEGPRALPETPGALPEAPRALPQDPGALPQDPGALPQDPGALPEALRALPQDPGALPEAPRALPQDPGALPEAPRALPQDPGALPQDPGALPEGSRALPQDPGALPEAPRALPQDPGALPEAPRALPQDPGALQRALLSLPQDPEALPELKALLEAADPRSLPVSAAELAGLAAALGGFAAPPRRERDGAQAQAEPAGGDPAPGAVAERAERVGSVFLLLLHKLEDAGRHKTPALRRVLGHAFVFAVTHKEKRPWTTAGSRAVAREVLQRLVRTAGCESVQEFLQGKEEDEEGGFGAVMDVLKPELTKDTWKCNPASKDVFSWSLFHLGRPRLCPHLGRVLPPALLLSDDFQEENKVLGVRCLHHIVLNVPGADLCQFNRAQVVFHALYNHLYSREAPLIQAVLLCLLDLLPVLERSQRHQSQGRETTSHWDQVLQLVLTHMEGEHRLALRRVYTGTLPAFVTRLGILIVRHLKRLERVILGYLEVSDGPEEKARLGILETLQCTIQHAWPRMPCRLPVLLKALLRLLWDVHTDQGPTPEPVRAALLHGATQCLILLDHCCQGQVKVLLEGVHSSCEENRVRECLRKVQEST